MLEIYSKCHNSPTNGPTGTQLGWSHPIMSPTCPHDAVAMATAAVYQRRIEHSAVMGVWRPNARTNFDEIRYTTARYCRNDSHMTKY